MVLSHELASAYAIFPTHPVSSTFLADILVKAHNCTIDDPDVELSVIDTQDFTNWTHEQLAEWAASPDHFNNESSPFQPSVFVVVDDKSEEENSVVIVSVDKEDLGRVLGSVRADVCFASVIPSLIDFNWNLIEEWQERAQEFGGVLRDTPIEEEVDPSAEPASGQNVWETNTGLRVLTFSGESAPGDEVWIAGVGTDSLRRHTVQDGENN